MKKINLKYLLLVLFSGLSWAGAPVIWNGVDAKFLNSGSVAIPGLAGVGCAQFDVNGKLTNTGSSCGSGSGSVTSVSATVPAFLSVAGSPITTSGTLAFSLSGTALPIANGGTAGTTAAAAFNNLNPMTTLGDIIYESGASTAARLAGNTTTTTQILTQTGTGVASAAPVWQNASVVGNTTDWVLDAGLVLNNTGSVSGQNIYSRRVGDTYCARGAITPGAGTGSIATMSLPSGIVIDSAKIPGNTELGLWLPTTGGVSQLFAANVGNIIFYDGSDTTHVYFGPRSAGSVYYKDTGNDLSFANPASLDFCVPVVGWSSSTLTTNVVNARYTNSATGLSGALATISWTNKSYDSDNAMSSGTYTVAASEGGKFHVDSAIFVAGTFALNNNVDMQLQLNGTAICEDLEDAGGAVAAISAQVHCDFAASAGDTIRVQVSSSATGPSITSSVSRNYFNLFRNSQ